MTKIFFKGIILSGMVLLTTCTARHGTGDGRPNILFIIADDASLTGSAIGPDYIKTPNFDRIANEGILFTNAFSTNPKCTPARACILTGRYSWQLEEASVHRALMPEKWMFYPELLEEGGYQVGSTGKGWGPGIWTRGEHNPAGRGYNSIKLEPSYTGISKTDYSENFRMFLDDREGGKPFCFWLGTYEPHRPYEKDSYLKAGRGTEKVKVQEFFPDNEIVKADLMDYAMEVEWYDQHIGKVLEILEERGELDNTLIIATSDHGMPFPRAKGQIYEEGCHIGFSVRWGNRIKPGRVVEDFINFPDIAPTFMEVAGLEPHPQMTGKSFLDLLLSKKSGFLDNTRNFSLLGRELHDPGRDDGDKIAVGYPVRAIRTKDFFYIRHYEPQRWPEGNPEHNYPECPNGPSKEYLISVSEDSLHPDFRYYELCLSFREGEELYDINQDKDCIHNLAGNPESKEIKEELAAKLQRELVKQEDPRALGNGAIFDTYYYMDFRKLKRMYGDRFQIPEHLEKYAKISGGKAN